MQYKHGIAVTHGLVSFYEDGHEPDVLDFEFGGMLMWSESSRAFGVAAMTKMDAISFELQELGSAPASILADEWEEIEELSALLQGSIYRLMDWEFNQQHIPAIELVSAPGFYRLRLYARGRTAPVELQRVDDELINEHYLLQVWTESEARQPLALQRLS